MKIKLICILYVFASINIFGQQEFHLDLTNVSDDLFHVVLYPEQLSEENKIYQFAATAPGTYQTMDIGRFVRSFKAFDENGNEIETKNISTNQYLINDPAKVKKIEYSIDDTWGTHVDSNKIYLMGGSSIEKNNILINGQCVFGYFEGMQSEPIKVKIDFPKNWDIGTALHKNNDGFYEAPTYDYIVDSPILLGELSKDSIKIDSTKIKVYAYSKTDLIQAKDLLSSIRNILTAARDFMEGLPVKNYTFLFYFGRANAGAWEHSYSSEYVYREQPLNERMINNLRSTIAHEFFHIVTPLNIHSELIEKFNFVKPVMSRHLWLYEGTTEWASDALQLRDSLITLNDFLDEMHKKLLINELFNQNLSLTELSRHSTEMQDQYYNIYTKGAVTAALLDIRLLDLSNGTRGLREIINELSEKYGVNRSFSEENFFDDFTKMTYPEIGDFFKKYIEGTEKLPVKEYFKKIGINYYETKGYDSTDVSLGIQIGFKDSNLVIAKVDNSSPNYEIVFPSDILLKINGVKISFGNIQKILAQLSEKKPGEKVILTVFRNDEEKNLTMELYPKLLKHIFEVDQNPSQKQLDLRNAWLKNL